LKNSLETSEDATNVDTVTRSIAFQSLLHIGSRSFSHLLNAIERYLPLLRSLSGSSIMSASGHTEAKSDILTAAALFWKRNRHMIMIVFDKLMQYQIVDPNDVVGWVFANGGVIGGGGTLGLGAFGWDLLRSVLDKANGRVMIARRKVKALKKEEDDTIAREKASGVDVTSMEVDPDARRGNL
jgi:nuclear cap-binding protein subunit 1